MLTNPQPWVKQARCRGTDPTLFDGDWKKQREAKEVCEQCPVRALCLEYALSNERGCSVNGRGGIYGGTNRHERARMDRERRAAA